jgi:uncharacterized protein YegL
MATPISDQRNWDLTAAAVMPGGGIDKRPLHFIIAADGSWSMNGEKMQALNYSIATMLPQLVAWERAQENARVLVRAIKFANHAEWHVQQPTPVADLKWTPLRCEPRALTHMGAGLRLMASVLTADALERRALKPALLLITDGIATDDFEGGLAALMATPGGAGALRIAVAIGPDARSEQLAKFSDPSLAVLRADRAEDIPDLLRVVSVAVGRMSEVGTDRQEIAKQLNEGGFVTPPNGMPPVTPGSTSAPTTIDQSYV